MLKDMYSWKGNLIAFGVHAHKGEFGLFCSILALIKAPELEPCLCCTHLITDVQWRGCAW